MTEEKQLFTPADPAEYLSKRAGRKITVGRLAQLRREKRVNATVIGYNATVYTREDLDNADISLNIPGRNSSGEISESEALGPGRPAQTQKIAA